MFYNMSEVVLMIPDQYKHETDYRNIPREYLDANIPQGRGMIKWAPFAVMPEPVSYTHLTLPTNREV